MTRKLLTTAAILIIAVIAFALSDPGRDGPDQVTTRESPSVFPELN